MIGWVRSRDSGDNSANGIEQRLPHYKVGTPFPEKEQQNPCADERAARWQARDQ
jgi:hypothetical protein